MQTLKVTAFWIRPPCAGEALGGNPQACAYAGGRIQKGWVSAHDAALEGLVECLHESGRLALFGAALYTVPIQFGPYVAPVVPQITPGNRAAGCSLNGQTPLNGDAAILPIADRLNTDIQQAGQLRGASNVYGSEIERVWLVHIAILHRKCRKSTCG